MLVLLLLVRISPAVTKPPASIAAAGPCSAEEEDAEGASMAGTENRTAVEGRDSRGGAASSVGLCSGSDAAGGVTGWSTLLRCAGAAGALEPASKLRREAAALGFGSLANWPPLLVLGSLGLMAAPSAMEMERLPRDPTDGLRFSLAAASTTTEASLSAVRPMTALKNTWADTNGFGSQT